MRKLSKTDRIRILLNAGKTPLAIAKSVRCTPSYVYRLRKERTRVRLTKKQVATARRLGITPAEYAAHKIEAIRRGKLPSNRRFGKAA